MDKVLSVALTSLQQDMNRLDRVALNLVNASTPGYKREVAAARPFMSLIEDGTSSAGHSAGSHPVMASMPLQIALDLRPGAVKLTGEPLDLALTGDGFFEVQTENGPAYTRQGNFHTDAQGRLVTAHGYGVTGRNGDIFLTTKTPRIDALGNITEPDASPRASGLQNGPIAQIKVVHFDDTSHMQHLGEGLLTPGEGISSRPRGAGPIRQGALENANVSTAHEMVELIQTMRHFESVQKITQGYHEMLGIAIHKLGDLS